MNLKHPLANTTEPDLAVRWTPTMQADATPPRLDPATLTCPLAADVRALLLVIVRESNAYDYVQMESMAGQTYAGLPGDPIATALGRMGMTPMSGEEFDLEVDLGDISVTVRVVPEVRRHASTKAVLFRVGRTYHLWSMASAASIGQASKVNAWNQIVMDVIRELRPIQLHAATVSRLIRSHRQALLLQDAMLDNVDFMTFGGMRLEFTGAQAAFGNMMLSILGMMAAQERDWIMQRLLAGQIALHRRGLWQFGYTYVPFGYRYDKATKMLVIDEEAAEIVPKMIDVLISDENYAMKVLRLSKLGVKKRRARRHEADTGPASLDTSVVAAGAIHQLVASASIWVHGQYVVRVKNPGLLYDHIAGVPIVRESDRDCGELQMVEQLPVPEGGWAAPDKLEALWQIAIRREKQLMGTGNGHRALSPELAALYPHLDIASFAADVQDPTVTASSARGPRIGGRRKRMMTALTGRRWRQDGHMMEVAAVAGGRYEIRAMETNIERGRLHEDV